MKRRATLGVIAAAAALPARAHHSTSMYDRSTPVTIRAEVLEFRWVNPHSYFTVVETGAASGADGTRHDLQHRAAHGVAP